MSIRRHIRKALQTGTTIYARVEDVSLGLATVRLGGIGVRLTNLSTVGGEVAVGDTVIVDYSAGVNPIVRPLFVQDEPEELPLGISVPETPIDDEDISTFQDTWYSWETETYLAQGVPHQFKGGSFNYFDDPYYTEYWDSANICPNSSRFEDGAMTVPRDGKYLIGFQWLEPLQKSTEEPGPDPTTVESSCFYRIQILKNNAAIAEGTGQWFLGFWGETSINISTFEPLLSGDRITFEVMFTSNVVTNYWFDNWGYFDAESRTRWLIYLPGT
jgi:hypothetical protein